MNPRALPSGPVDQVSPGHRFVKSGRFLAAVVVLIGISLTVHVAPAMAQLPDFPGQLPGDLPKPPEPKPVCVSCGPGYHCVHDPAEGCEADDPPPPPPIDPNPGPLQQPE